MGEKDAQQLGGTGALLAARAAGREAPDSRRRHDQRHDPTDPQLQEEILDARIVKHDLRRNAEHLEIVVVEKLARDPVDEGPVPGRVHETEDRVERDGRQKNPARRRGDGQEERPGPTVLLARVLLASAQSCTPIPRRS